MPEKLNLAQLRTSPAASLPRRSYSLCLAGSVLAEVRTLAVELADLESVTTPEPTRRKQRLGEGEAPPREPSPRETEIRERMSVLGDTLDAHTGELVVEAIEPGAWCRLCDDHPPREGHRRDERVGLGVINADILLSRLGDFGREWNGEPLQAGDWQWMESKAAPGDLNGLARLVVTMHEQAVDLPKLRADLRGSLKNGSA